jgi:hypothetical protein
MGGQAKQRTHRYAQNAGNPKRCRAGAQIGNKAADEFEQTYGCSLTVFVDVVFGPEQKRPTGPAPAAHTKVDRSAKRFKSLGSPKLTRSVIQRYLGLLKTYRADLLPAEAQNPSNVIPFNSKQ